MILTTDHDTYMMLTTDQLLCTVQIIFYLREKRLGASFVFQNQFRQDIRFVSKIDLSRNQMTDTTVVIFTVIKDY